MKKTLLYSVLLLVFLGLANNLVAQEKGQFSIFANFGGGSLEDKEATAAIGTISTKVGEIKINALKLGLGINYAHPVGKAFSVGGMFELRLLFNKTEFSPLGISGVNFGNSTGLGIALGPYFRLGLWGVDKKGGIGFAPYFLVNSLRPEETLAGVKIADSVLGLGGGLMLDIYFIKNFGVNLGLELQYADFNTTTFASGVFGPVFYAGLIISF